MNKLTTEVARRDIGHLKAHQDNPKVGLSMREELYLQALEIALPVLEQEGGWISCSARLPKDDGQYWGWWSEENRQGPVWFIERQSQFQSYQITHWMPLPAPPQSQPSTNPQIDNDGWVEWGGGLVAPVTGMVEVRLRSCSSARKAEPATDWVWKHRGTGDDIIAYRVIENNGREG